METTPGRQIRKLSVLSTLRLAASERVAVFNIGNPLDRRMLRRNMAKRIIAAAVEARTFGDHW